MCLTARGCKIEELAQDKEITRLAETFIEYRALLNNELYRPLAIEGLKSKGLDEPNLLLELESRVVNYIKSQPKENKIKEPQKRKMI